MNNKFLSGFYPRFAVGPVALALLIVRVVAGLAFMFHGWPKIQNPTGWMGPNAPMPGILQALAATSEFCGGFAWIIGALTPLASLGIFSTMGVAIYTHAIVRGDPFVGRGTSYELALVYLTIAVLLVLVGPGQYSVDAVLFGKKRGATP